MAERCKHTCPGGSRCCCDGAVDHSLHICSSAACPCHTEARYENRLLVVDMGPVDPLGMHWRAVTVLQAEQREAVTA